jgi:capsular polysaccharide transport system permease protein
MAELAPARPPFTVTMAVWRAMFLREAVARMSRERAAWLWLVVEPAFHIAFLMFLFSTIRVRVVGGIETQIWIMVGLLAFFMFRRPAQQAMNAIGANQALFTFRQVKPVDPVLVRAVLEGFLMAVVTILLLIGAGLVGFANVPADPLAVVAAFSGLWLFGLGFGLVVSVANELTPELGRFISLLMQPLYFFSGVIFPLDALPSPYREWLLLNPVAHGLEGARLGFAPLYRAVPELSLPYLFGCAMVTVFFGLALHHRFAIRLAAR